MAELSMPEAAALVGVSPRTWRLWEAAGDAMCSMSFAHYRLFILVTNQWSRFHLEPGYPPRERQCKVTDVR